MRRAKIIATIGPASESPDRLRALFTAGVDVARINMSHGDRRDHGEVITRIRDVAAELKRPVAVMLDLCGPKIRTGRLRGGSAMLETGAEVLITSEDIEGDSTRFSASYARLTQEVHPGDRILIGDGEIELQVSRVTAGDVTAKVVHGGILGEHKGVNLPGTRISIPSVTEKDVADLQFGVEHGIDLVAQSFVRSADDCRQARELIARLHSGARLIAKIEKPEAVDHIDGILEIADGVMVARGDLAVETSPEVVPILQKKIIARSLIAQKTVITATQMLQSMMESPLPTRAEASDVANAVLDGSDAVMLSGETAVGKFPIETVAMMDRIIRSTEELSVSPTSSSADGPTGVDPDHAKSRVGADIYCAVPATMRESISGQRSGSIGRALAEAAAFAAEEVGCRLIVVFTQSGHMARRISAVRPRQRIIALTPHTETLRQLAVSWGVEPYPLYEGNPGSDAVLACGDRALLLHGLAEPGERVVFMAGKMNDIAMSTSMKVHTVGSLQE